MASTPQTRSSHARYVPGYHYLLALFLLVILGTQIYALAKRPSYLALVDMVLAVSLILMFWYMREFAVTVQDRVIRLEERLRLERLLPADLKERIPDFTVEHLVALRFASDAELPALARRVLDEKIDDQKQIKALVKEWRADYLRA
jgi:hypothetical protein